MTKNNTGEYFTYLGETKSVKAWGKDSRCAVCDSTLRKRLKKGWDFESAFTDAKTEKSGRKVKHLYSFNGETKSIPEWAEDDRCTASLTTLYARIYTYKWDFEKAFTTPVKFDMREVPIEIGQKFGMLTTLGKSDSNTKGQRKWRCLCECGKEIQARSWHLRNGNYSSCGCMLKIRAAQIHKKYKEAYPPDYPWGFNEVYNSYRKEALKKKLNFDLSKEEFFNLSQQHCYYCDCLPKNRKVREEDFVYSGIDRIDNKKGYQIDNTVPCCKICNIAKNNLELEVFLKHVTQLYLNLKDKNLI